MPQTNYHQIINQLKEGRHLSGPQILAFAEAVRDDSWPDYQIAALLMAWRLKGLTQKETFHLTQAMTRLSERLHLKKKGIFVIDKHSTGGVGDGISLVLAPLAASFGLKVPMMSGRSLGLTGGTLDKLESITNLKTQLKPRQIKAQVNSIGLAMFGQSEELAPVDKKLYALRDAIEAVDCLGFVVSSILSKKLIEDLDGLVFDVKVGRGAIFETQPQARNLAQNLVQVAQRCGLKARALLTDMEEPLGSAIGNSLEIAQAWRILQGRWGRLEEDFVQVTLELFALMMSVAKKEKIGKAKEMGYECLREGRAAAKFVQMLQAQGVPAKRAAQIESYLPKAKKIFELKSPKSGWVKFVDAKEVASATLRLGALRATQEDTIDPSAGVILLKKAGDRAKRGETLAEIHASRALDQDCKMALKVLSSAFSFSAVPVKSGRRILGVIP